MYSSVAFRRVRNVPQDRVSVGNPKGEKDKVYWQLSPGAQRSFIK